MSHLSCSSKLWKKKKKINVVSCHSQPIMSMNLDLAHNNRGQQTGMLSFPPMQKKSNEEKKKKNTERKPQVMFELVAVHNASIWPWFAVNYLLYMFVILYKTKEENVS